MTDTVERITDDFVSALHRAQAAPSKSWQRRVALGAWMLAAQKLDAIGCDKEESLEVLANASELFNLEVQAWGF